MHEGTAARFQCLAQFQALLDFPPSLDPVGGRDAHAHRQIGRHCGTHGIEHFERKAHAVFQRAAVVVDAVVRQRRQELVQQVAMRGMQFDDIQAEAGGAAGGVDEAVADTGEAGLIECHRRWLVGQVRDGGRCHRLPAAGLRRDQRAAIPGCCARGLASRMRQLDAERHRRILAHPFQHPTQRGFGVVRIEAEVVRRDAAIGGHRGGFDDQQSGAGQRELAQMDEVPVGGLAVFGRVLAHRRDDDAVGQLQLAQAEWCEELAHAISLRVLTYTGCRGAALRGIFLPAA